ncbi:MAG: hypothetical protein KDD82_22465, partial [Planctomycetes bacterium]|nr:hypothetical protein [Planctomycetota bacterium]
AARVADPAPAGPPAYAPPSGASRGQLRAVQRAGDGSLEAWSADQIERGLGWLVASQAPDGAWWSDAHSPEGTTALAVAAFAASGSTHRSGPQRARVARALSWLCLRQDLGCFLTRSEDRPLLTLALSLLYMQTQDANLAQRLRRSATQVLGLKQDPVWSPVARSAAATALAKLGPPQQVERHEGGPAPDLVRALPHPQRWVANSWFAPPESPARAGWRAALVVHLHHLQHPAGPWTGEDDPGQLNLSWNTARNVLALALLAD